jgi:DNA-binding NtrC family response regulator
LIVDDEETLLDILVEHFINSNYEVETAASGVEALTAIVRARPDLVLLDINMPRMSGIEVLKEILKIDPTITVIMVSGISDVAITTEAFRNGAFGFVPKPFDFRYLLHLIAVTVDK